jgi:hypothetical protein
MRKRENRERDRADDQEDGGLNATTGFSPRQKLRHSGWAWSGRSLWPHQRNMNIEGIGVAMLKGPGENTGQHV